MKVKTISYQKTFNLGNYCSERIGLDLELEEGKTIEQTLDEAKKTATDWHIANNPQLYTTPKSKFDPDVMKAMRKSFEKSHLLNEDDPYHEERATTPSLASIIAESKSSNGMADSFGIKTKEQPIEKRSNSIADQLNTCTDLISLECYKLIVKGKPDLQKAYDQKMKELTK